MVKILPAMWRPRFDPKVGKIPWRRDWLPTPVFLPREFNVQRSPGRLQSMGPQRIAHDWLTNAPLFNIGRVPQKTLRDMYEHVGYNCVKIKLHFNKSFYFPFNYILQKIRSHYHSLNSQWFDIRDNLVDNLLSLFPRPSNVLHSSIIKPCLGYYHQILPINPLSFFLLPSNESIVPFN